MPINDSFGKLYDDRDDSLPGRRSVSAHSAGAPLSVGGHLRGSSPESIHTAPTRANSRAAAPAETSEPPAAGGNFQKAIHAFQVAVPFLQKLLPLFDGQIAAAVSSILPSRAPAAVPAETHESALVPARKAVAVDLTQIEDRIDRLQMAHGELCKQISVQNTSLKHVEDHLDMVREATDRNTLEQQELMEDIKNVTSKVNLVTLVVLAMLLGSLLLNLILYLHLQRVLP